MPPTNYNEMNSSDHPSTSPFIRERWLSREIQEWEVLYFLQYALNRIVVSTPCNWVSKTAVNFVIPSVTCQPLIFDCSESDIDGGPPFRITLSLNNFWGSPEDLQLFNAAGFLLQNLEAGKSLDKLIDEWRQSGLAQLPEPENGYQRQLLQMLQQGECISASNGFNYFMLNKKWLQLDPYELNSFQTITETIRDVIWHPEYRHPCAPTQCLHILTEDDFDEPRKVNAVFWHHRQPVVLAPSDHLLLEPSPGDYRLVTPQTWLSAAAEYMVPFDASERLRSKRINENDYLHLTDQVASESTRLQLLCAFDASEAPPLFVTA
jgi:hypothetical protein